MKVSDLQLLPASIDNIYLVVSRRSLVAVHPFLVILCFCSSSAVAAAHLQWWRFTFIRRERRVRAVWWVPLRNRKIYLTLPTCIYLLFSRSYFNGHDQANAKCRRKKAMPFSQSFLREDYEATQQCCHVPNTTG